MLLLLTPNNYHHYAHRFKDATIYPLSIHHFCPLHQGYPRTIVDQLSEFAIFYLDVETIKLNCVCVLIKYFYL